MYLEEAADVLCILQAGTLLTACQDTFQIYCQVKCYCVISQPAVLDACLWLCIGHPETGGVGSGELPDVGAGAQVLAKVSFFEPQVWYLRIVKTGGWVQHVGG